MTQNHDAFSDLAPLPECFVDDARHHPVNVAREPLYPVFYYCDCGRTWRLTEIDAPMWEEV